MTDLDLPRIKRMLAERCVEVCRHLFPSGSLRGHEYCIGNLRGEPGNSLKINCNGKAGVGQDFATGQKFSNLLDLWNHAYGRGEKLSSETIREAEAFLEINPAGRPTSGKGPQLARGDRPLTQGGPVFRYFTVERKIEPYALAKYGVLEGCVRDGSRSLRAYVFPARTTEGELEYVKRVALERRPDGKKIVQTNKSPQWALWGKDVAGGNRRCLLITEGEIDALSWFQAGFPAVSVPNGVAFGGWIERERKFLDGFQQILIAFDSDLAGRNGAEALAREIGTERAMVVEIKGHKDANEALVAGDLAALCEAYANPRRLPPVSSKQQDGPFDVNDLSPLDQGDIPAGVFPVPCGGITHSQSAEIIFGKIGAAPGKRLFHRGCGEGGVVEVIDGELSAVSPERFVSLVEQFGNRVARRECNGSPPRVVWRSATFPVSAAKVALASDAARVHLPSLRQLSSCPILTPEGRMLGPGWHPENGGLFVTGKGRAENVPLNAAVPALLGLLDDFAFATPADRSRAAASLISPALRAGEWIAEDFPLDVAEADASQSGKTYRQKIAAAIYAEQPAAIIAANGGVGSLDEAVATALIAGRPFIILDNIRGRVDSALLESAIRGHGRVSCRALRKQANVDTRPFNWLLSTNGAELTRDLANRSIIIRVRKRPEGYRFCEWLEGDTLSHVRSCQPFYLGCVFAVLREWIRLGKSKTGEDRHDFRAWVQSMDYIVQEILGLDPLLEGHREQQCRLGDPNLQWLRDVALAIQATAAIGKDFRSAELGELAEESGVEWPRPSKDAMPLRVGRLMGKIFSDANSVSVDAFTVVRRQETSWIDPGGKIPWVYSVHPVHPV